MVLCCAYLGGEVFEDGGEVNRRPGSNTFGVTPLLQETGNPADGELEPRLWGSGNGLRFRLASAADGLCCGCLLTHDLRGFLYFGGVIKIESGERILDRVIVELVVRIFIASVAVFWLVGLLPARIAIVDRIFSDLRYRALLSYWLIAVNKDCLRGNVISYPACFHIIFYN